jgi:hypothetical protein
VSRLDLHFDSISAALAANATGELIMPRIETIIITSADKNVTELIFLMIHNLYSL